MSEIENLELIKDLSLCENVAVGIFKFVGYGLGCLTSLPSFICSDKKKKSKICGVKSTKKIENDSLILGSVNPMEKFINAVPKFTRIAEFLEHPAKTFPNKKYFGKRKVLSKSEIVEKESNKKIAKYKLGNYEWKTFSQVYNEYTKLCTSLKNLGFNETSKMVLFANTSPEWLTTVFALSNISSPFATVYATLPDDSIIHALNLVEAVGVLVDERTCFRVVNLSKHVPTLKYIVYFSFMDQLDSSTIKLDDQSLQLIPYQSLITDNIPPYVQDSSKSPSSGDDVAVIMFTSGSTGIPKGVMISHNNIIAMRYGILAFPQLFKAEIYAAFLPSSHIFEFVVEILLTGFGRSIGFCTPLTIFDTSPMIDEGVKGDFSVLKPTLVVTVPLLLERVKKGVFENLRKGGRFKQILLQTAYNMKRYFRSYGCTTPIIDRLIFKPLRNVFGGKVTAALIGGAYISPNTHEFANLCFSEFRQGYGLTETCAGGTLGDYDYFPSGNVGGVLGCCEIMLVPWEEGSCFPLSETSPRGEIVISGPNVALGYYKNEELTQSSFVKDPKTGKVWFYTGDIAELLPDMTLKIVDRKKDIIKLLHGEYVSLVRVETHVGNNDLIEMICVLPNASMEYLVALIIPNRERTRKFVESKGHIIGEENIEEYIKNETIKNQILGKINEILVDGYLNRHEIPKYIHILPDFWTPENNLVTPSLKLRRAEISKFYKHLLT